MMFSLRKPSVKYLLVFTLLHFKKITEKKLQFVPQKKGGKWLLGKKGFMAGNSSCLHICSRNGICSQAVSNHLTEFFSRNTTSTFLDSGMNSESVL